MQVNAFESVVFEMAAILSRPQCVKLLNAIYYGSFFSTKVGERRLHSNPVGTPKLVWIGWKLQKFSLQNFQLIPLSPWVPAFHTQ